MNFIIMSILNQYANFLRISLKNYALIVSALFLTIVILVSRLIKYLDRKNDIYKLERDFYQYLLDGIKSLPAHKMKDGDTIYIMLDVDDINLFLEKGKR